MKTPKLISITFLIMLLGSCNTPIQTENDLKEVGLKGKVKSIKETTYEATEKFGEIQKGNIYNHRNSINEMSFNKQGNIIEENYYNPSPPNLLNRKHITKYGEKRNKIETNKYDADGHLITKY